MTHPDQQDILQFLHHENELLDACRYQEWLALFDPGGVYWIPAAAGQRDAEQEISIVHEDLVLLEMRIGRLLHPRAHGLDFPIRTSRVLGNVQVQPIDSGQVQADGRFILHEWQKGRMRTFAGAVRYVLKPSQHSWRIALKRIDLVNVEEAFESIQIIL